MVAQLFDDFRPEQITNPSAHLGLTNIDDRIIKSIGTCRPRDGATDEFYLWQDQLSRVLGELGIKQHEPMPQPPAACHSPTAAYQTPNTTAHQLKLEKAYAAAKAEWQAHNTALFHVVHATRLI